MDNIPKEPDLVIGFGSDGEITAFPVTETPPPHGVARLENEIENLREQVISLSAAVLYLLGDDAKARPRGYTSPTHEGHKKAVSEIFGLLGNE